MICWTVRFCTIKTTRFLASYVNISKVLWQRKTSGLISKKNQVEGMVTLKVTFLNDGTIGDISVVKGINKELNESAVSAAKLIKFEPERKKGKPVTIMRSIQYTFMLY